MRINKHLEKLLIYGFLVSQGIGCASLKYPQNITSIENPLNRREAKITYKILKEGEKEFKQLEQKFYKALDSGNTNTPEFDELQTKYHSMKAQREKYEIILRLNTEK